MYMPFQTKNESDVKKSISFLNLDQYLDDDTSNFSFLYFCCLLSFKHNKFFMMRKQAKINNIESFNISKFKNDDCKLMTL